MDDAICGRCSNVAQHVFPMKKSSLLICSHCYAAQRLHTQGSHLTQVGILALAVGVGILIALVFVLLAS